MYKLLFVDDDIPLLKIMENYFSEKGYEVLCAENAKKAIDIIQTNNLDCVILDIVLPDSDGFEVCTCARESTGLPIIFLSSYGEEENRIKSFEVGGDDFVCKPFSMEELELRVHIRITRRFADVSKETLRFDGLEINIGQRCVSYLGKVCEFTSIEFDILLFLCSHPNQVFTYEQIYDSVWHVPLNTGLHNLQVCIARVRQKLATNCSGKHYIKTLRRKGYMFVY